MNSIIHLSGEYIYMAQTLQKLKLSSSGEKAQQAGFITSYLKKEAAPMVAGKLCFQAGSKVYLQLEACQLIYNFKQVRFIYNL